jgi:CBS domain-containing protein
VGQVFAILLFFVGLVSTNLFMVLIALFVYLGAETEERQMGIMMSLGGSNARTAMIRDIDVLSPDTSVGEAATRFAHGFQADFPVLEGQRLVGLVTREILVDTLHRQGPQVQVSAIMIKDFPTAVEETPLIEILEKMEAGHSKAVPILRMGELRGMITLEQIGRYNMLCSGYSCEFMQPGTNQNVMPATK